jgi:hypothetical protein
MIIRNTEEIQVTKKNCRSEGKMNFAREGKKIPHTITNIPAEGVYLGVYFIIIGNSYLLFIINYFIQFIYLFCPFFFLVF